MGFDFTLIAPLLPSHCGFSFVFGCGVSFLVSSSVFLSMIVQQLASCDSGVLARESESTSFSRFCFISTIFFNTPFVFNLFFNLHCNSEKDIISSIYKGGN